nr:MAG TPA: hypothetical protein [Caudoviricetes sp.]
MALLYMAYTPHQKDSFTNYKVFFSNSKLTYQKYHFLIDNYRNGMLE